MKEYLKAIGRRKKAIRERKDLEQQVTKLMGNNNYQVYRSNQQKRAQVVQALEALRTLLNAPGDNDFLNLVYADLNSSIMENYEDVERIIGTTVVIDANTTVKDILKLGETAAQKLDEANEKLACTPKIRAGLEKLITLNQTIQSIETEYGINET